MNHRIQRIIFAGAFLALAGFGQAEADDCKLIRIASFDFENRSDGLIVIPVSIEGQTEPMALDTGSLVSFVDPKLVDTLHLINYPITEDLMFNTFGQRYTRAATVNRLGIGTMQGAHIDMLISPSSLSRDGSIAGMLGTDLLRQFDLDIDFGARKVNMFSQNHCEGKVVYWPASAVTVIPVHILNTGQIKVPVTLDNHSFDAMLDTGSANTHLTLQTARNLFGLVPDTPQLARVGSFGPGGTTPVYQHVFGALDIQGITFGHPTIQVLEDLARTRMEETPALGSRISHADEAENVTNLTLGNSELHNLHLYIAYKEQKLYVSAASAPAVASAGTAEPATGSALAH